MNINELTEKIIGCGINVHKKLGPGYLEAVYQEALEYELKNTDIAFEREKELMIAYDDIILKKGFRCDFFVENQVIVECKAVKKVTEMDFAQIINYLKAAELRIGLLFNFNVPLFKDGIKRFINGYAKED